MASLRQSATNGRLPGERAQVTRITQVRRQAIQATQLGADKYAHRGEYTLFFLVAILVTVGVCKAMGWWP